MVAHNLTDTPAFPVVMVRRRPFFQENLLTRFLTLGLYIMPSDKVEVESCSAVAALIIRAQGQDITVNREGAMKPYLPLSIGFGRLKKTTLVSPIARNRSWSPQWCGAGRQRQSAVSKGLLASS